MALIVSKLISVVLLVLTLGIMSYFFLSAAVPQDGWDAATDGLDLEGYEPGLVDATQSGGMVIGDDQKVLASLVKLSKAINYVGKPSSYVQEGIDKIHVVDGKYLGGEALWGDQDTFSSSYTYRIEVFSRIELDERADDHRFWASTLDGSALGRVKIPAHYVYGFCPSAKKEQFVSCSRRYEPASATFTEDHLCYCSDEDDGRPGKAAIVRQAEIVYNVRVTVFDSAGRVVAQETTHVLDQTSFDHGFYEGLSKDKALDLKTWAGRDEGRKLRSPAEKSCFDSPTLIDVPPLRVYYCGKEGLESDAKKRTNVDGEVGFVFFVRYDNLFDGKTSSTQRGINQGAAEPFVAPQTLYLPPQEDTGAAHSYVYLDAGKEVSCEGSGEGARCLVKGFELPQSFEGVNDIDTFVKTEYAPYVGDPQYLVYYNAFPEGEDAAWRLDTSSFFAAGVGFDMLIVSGFSLVPGGAGILFKSMKRSASQAVKELGREPATVVAEHALETFSKELGSGFSDRYGANAWRAWEQKRVLSKAKTQLARALTDETSRTSYMVLQRASLASQFGDDTAEILSRTLADAGIDENRIAAYARSLSDRAYDTDFAAFRVSSQEPFEMGIRQAFPELSDDAVTLLSRRLASASDQYTTLNPNLARKVLEKVEPQRAELFKGHLFQRTFFDRLAKNVDYQDIIERQGADPVVLRKLSQDYFTSFARRADDISVNIELNPRMFFVREGTGTFTEKMEREFAQSFEEAFVARMKVSPYPESRLTAAFKDLFGFDPHTIGATSANRLDEWYRGSFMFRVVPRPGIVKSSATTLGRVTIDGLKTAMDSRAFRYYLIYLMSQEFAVQDLRNEKFTPVKADALIVKQPYALPRAREFLVSTRDEVLLLQKDVSASPNGEVPYSQFYLASPCKADLIVEKKTCSCLLRGGDYVQKTAKGTYLPVSFGNMDPADRYALMQGVEEHYLFDDKGPSAQKEIIDACYNSRSAGSSGCFDKLDQAGPQQELALAYFYSLYRLAYGDTDVEGVIIEEAGREAARAFFSKQAAPDGKVSAQEYRTLQAAWDLNFGEEMLDASAFGQHVAQSMDRYGYTMKDFISAVQFFTGDGIDIYDPLSFSYQLARMSYPMIRIISSSHPAAKGLIKSCRELPLRSVEDLFATSDDAFGSVVTTVDCIKINPVELGTYAQEMTEDGRQPYKHNFCYQHYDETGENIETGIIATSIALDIAGGAVFPPAAPLISFATGSASVLLSSHLKANYHWPKNGALP